MINVIKYIPKSIDIEKLKPYKKDSFILEKLNISELLVNDINNEDVLVSEDTYICESDLVVFSTLNTEEESNLQFYIYDKEHNDFMIHHDIFVLSAINDAIYLNFKDFDYIALGTFDKYVYLYDSLIFNPIAPQILLEGHTESVMCVLYENNKFLSGSEDKSIIEWDLEKNMIKSQFRTEDSIEKISLLSENIYYSQKNIIKNLNNKEIITLDGNIENLVSLNHNIFATTSTGFLTVYDDRNINKPYFSNKYCDAHLTGLDILKNKIGLCSEEGNIYILDALDFEIKYSEILKSNLYSIKLNEDNLIFYGDENNLLNMKSLNKQIF